MELVNYLYGWYTNEANTTWYREPEVVAPAPKKRTRKVSTSTEPVVEQVTETPTEPITD
jgi:hypothetical protein